MDRRQRKRLLIFLLVPLLAVILFVTDDVVIRVITIALIVIYVAFIIFLRDSLKFGKNISAEYENDFDDDLYSSPEASSHPDYDESFKIVSKNKDVEIITADNFTHDSQNA